MDLDLKKIMIDKIKKYISQDNIDSGIFKEIDSKLLNGWECVESSKSQKHYLDQLKYQTGAAMENKKYFF